jgi:hypothetical protein
VVGGDGFACLHAVFQVAESGRVERELRYGAAAPEKLTALYPPGGPAMADACAFRIFSNMFAKDMVALTHDYAVLQAKGVARSGPADADDGSGEPRAEYALVPSVERGARDDVVFLLDNRELYNLFELEEDAGERQRLTNDNGTGKLSLAEQRARMSRLRESNALLRVPPAGAFAASGDYMGRAMSPRHAWRELGTELED